MRLSTSALLALPATALAVTLSDFTPRVSNLASSCETVYTQSIAGCQPSDFTGSCSASCVEALTNLVPDVQSACGNDKLTGTNIIVAFLDGDGPGSLCADAAQIMSSLSASQAAASSTAPASSSTTSTSSTTSASSSGKSTTSTVALTSTDTVTAASTSSSSAIIVAGSTSSASGTSSAQKSSQTSMSESGGGSPFDTAGNGWSGATALSTSSWTITILTTLLAFAFTLR